jgi:hypothetical protein
MPEGTLRADQPVYAGTCIDSKPPQTAASQRGTDSRTAPGGAAWGESTGTTWERLAGADCGRSANSPSRSARTSRSTAPFG